MRTHEESLRRGRIWQHAAKAIRLALAEGTLVKPTACEECGSIVTIEPAHFDYARPLDIRWLCLPCHRTWDAAQPKTHSNAVPLLPRGNHETNRLPRQRNTYLLAELQRQGRSIRWFCEHMGVSRWAFWRIETGDAGAPLDWYQRAAVLLGVPAGDIRPRTDSEAATKAA